MRNKLLGKYSSDRAQISTLETILSLFWLTLRDWIFFKGLIIFLLCRQQDLIWYFTGKGCGLLNPTTVSTAGVTLSAAGLWGITFNRSILEKFTVKNMTKKSWAGSNRVTVRYSKWKWGAGSKNLLLYLKYSCFVSVGFVFFFILSWKFINRKLKGKTRGHRPQVRCSG